MNLRPYQSTALTELWQWFYKHHEGNPIVEACVGAGKSVMIAALCQKAMSDYQGTRILVVVHQKELLEQNLDKLLKVWPDAPVGIHSAAVGKKDISHDALYTTIGSVYKKAHLLGRRDIVLCDECHLIAPREAGMWRQLISDLKRYNPATRVIGWTGTPFRGNGVWLTAGEDPLFHGIACRVTMRDLLDLGFLAPLTSQPTNTFIDASHVGIANGDYKVNELEAIADRDDIVEAACDEIVIKAADRKRWLVFCVTVAHAGHVSEALARRGIACAVVSAETPKAERADLISRFRNGELRALCNVAVLTTGFDVPEVDCISLLRNTKSPVLYVQIAGRGMRVVGADIHESIVNGKSNCLFLDFTGTVESLGPVNLVQGHAPRRRTSDTMPLKICDACGSPNAISARECIDCGAPFQIEETDPHRAEASGAAIISTEAASRKYEVTSVTYARHTKPGKPPSLRVEYWSGIRVVAKEWVGIESDSTFARSKASYWWWQRCGRSSPDNVEEALADAKRLRQPEVVIVNETKKYPEVVGYEWRAQ